MRNVLEQDWQGDKCGWTKLGRHLYFELRVDFHSIRAEGVYGDRRVRL